MGRDSERGSQGEREEDRGVDTDRGVDAIKPIVVCVRHCGFAAVLAGLRDEIVVFFLGQRVRLGFCEI